MAEGEQSRLVATVLFYPSEEVQGRWVAHCLDFDIVGTGDTPAEAFRELLQLVELQVETWHELGDEAIYPDRAPQVYWDALRAAYELPSFDISRLSEHIVERRVGQPELPCSFKGALLKDRAALAAVG